MRTIIDLEEAAIQALDQVAQTRGTSRAAVVREAVGRYLITECPAHPPTACFGRWAGRGADPETAIATLRDEWERAGSLDPAP